MYVKIDNKTSARYFQKETRAAKKGLRKVSSLSDEEKKRQYGVKRCKNLPQHEKQRST